jgi:hypothetical protein
METDTRTTFRLSGKYTELCDDSISTLRQPARMQVAFTTV